MKTTSFFHVSAELSGPEGALSFEVDLGEGTYAQLADFILELASRCKRDGLSVARIETRTYEPSAREKHLAEARRLLLFPPWRYC